MRCANEWVLCADVIMWCAHGSVAQSESDNWKKKKPCLFARIDKVKARIYKVRSSNRKVRSLKRKVRTRCSMLMWKTLHLCIASAVVFLQAPFLYVASAFVSLLILRPYAANISVYVANTSPKTASERTSGKDGMWRR